MSRRDSIGVLRRALLPLLRGAGPFACAAASIAGGAAYAARSPALSGPWEAEFELSALIPGNGGDGSEGFVLDGPDTGSTAGYGLTGGGDINGDGIDDFVVSAHNATASGGRIGAGVTFVLFGRADTDDPFPGHIELSSLLPENRGDGSAGFVLNGVGVGDASGRNVSLARDVNGDGVGDIIVGAPLADPHDRLDAGATYVVFGRASGTFPAAFELSSLLAANGGDGTTGFVANGARAGYQSSKYVSTAGDVNDDGITDIVIGEPYADGGGYTYIVFGRDTAHGASFPAEFELASLLPSNGGDGSAGFVLHGMNTPEPSNLGGAVAGAGDLNGDGIDDIAVGAPVASPPGKTEGGETVVVFGRGAAAGGFAPLIEMADLLPVNGGDGSVGFILNGVATFDASGSSVSAAGDVNDDGVTDLLIGATRGSPGGRFLAGQSYVVFGQTLPFPAVFELSALLPANGGDGSSGFVLDGISEFDSAGIALRRTGDMNGDGIDDIVIGSFATVAHRTGAGQSYVVFGRNVAQSGAFAAEIQLSSLLSANGGDGSAGFVLNGNHSFDSAGQGLGAAGDINGDGLDDLIVGAPAADPHGRSIAGQAYVVYGRAADSDGDGAPDTRDNCVLVANADQRDADADGIGNLCDADLNNDCNVNFIDLGGMKSAFFTSDANADLDGSGTVNFVDLGIMKSVFFAPPGPSGVPNICDTR